MSPGMRMHIGDWIGRGAMYWPDQVAVVDVAKGASGRFTYAALNARASALARWLQDTAGVGHGDRVGLVAHNGVEYLEAFFACGKLGAIFVPFNWRLHARELAETVHAVQPRVLLVGSDFRQALAEGGAAAPFQLCVDGPEYAAILERRPATPAGLPSREPTESDTACLLFTGGTSGRAKGARISHGMIAWNTLNTLIHEVRPGDVTVTHTPMFHTGGLLVYTLPLLASGGRVVLMRRWDADQLLQLIEQERVTLFFAVPVQYQQLREAARFPTTRFDSVRFVTSGGAPLPVPLLRAWQAVHPVPFKQGFGMTEFGPGLFSMGPEHAVSKAGSIGRPNYFIAARLVDDAGVDVAPGEVGELWLRGPAMCSGYDAGPGVEPLAAADADGWFHTGDLARCDADGFYFIVGRSKDMYISGGENVYPLELEAALLELPEVQSCAVVGVPDAQWGEAGCAFVVLAPDASATPDALLAHLRSRVARYKVPKRVVLMRELPTSPAGKILKRVLREEVQRPRDS